MGANLNIVSADCWHSEEEAISCKLQLLAGKALLQDRGHAKDCQSEQRIVCGVIAYLNIVFVCLMFVITENETTYLNIVLVMTGNKHETM